MIVLNKGLSGFFHGLIPAGLRERLQPNTATYMRVQALSAMLAINFAICAVAFLVSAVINLLFFPEQLQYDLGLFVIVALFALQTWLFYRFNNHWISSLAFTSFYFLMMMVMVLLTGGYESASKAILLSCPVLSFLISGRQEGVQNAAMSIAFCWALVLLTKIGFITPNVLQKINPQLIFALNWIISLIIISGALIIYEVELQKNMDRMWSLTALTKKSDSSAVKDRQQFFIFSWMVLKIRADLDIHSTAYMRMKILSILLVSGTVISAVATFMLVSIHLLISPERLQEDIVVGIITLCFGSQALLFYKRSYQTWSTNIFCYVYLMMILIMVLIGGGYDAPFKILLLTCPVVFFMICGIRAGLINVLLVAMIGCVLSYLKYTGYEVYNGFHKTDGTLMFGIAWTIAIIGVAACMWVYDTELEKVELITLR